MPATPARGHRARRPTRERTAPGGRRAVPAGRQRRRPNRRLSAGGGRPCTTIRVPGRESSAADARRSNPTRRALPMNHSASPNKPTSRGCRRCSTPFRRRWSRWTLVALDGFLCGVVLQPQTVRAGADGCSCVTDFEGRPPPPAYPEAGTAGAGAAAATPRSNARWPRATGSTRGSSSSTRPIRRPRRCCRGSPASPRRWTCSRR
ncbi:MAG: hypothetical protein MZW92_19250 [Comamonadaceae bacterium]|nr:hypothetical protein [Comamonadaceae bacterium]